MDVRPDQQVSCGPVVWSDLLPSIQSDLGQTMIAARPLKFLHGIGPRQRIRRPDPDARTLADTHAPNHFRTQHSKSGVSTHVEILW